MPCYACNARVESRAVHDRQHAGGRRALAGGRCSLLLVKHEARLELLLNRLARLIFEVGVELVDCDAAIAVVVERGKELVRHLQLLEPDRAEGPLKLTLFQRAVAIDIYESARVGTGSA